MLDLQDFIDYVNQAPNFNRHNGLHVTELRERYCVAEVALTQNGRNPQGVAHGSLVFALCDLATGMASASTNRNMLTLDASIHYLRPGTGEKLRCVAECVKDGRTTGLYEAKVYNEEDTLLAVGSFTVFYTGGEIDLALRRERDAEAVAAEREQD